MIQLFGDFNDDPITSEEYLILGFSPSLIPLKRRWRNNGLSADFMGDYLTTFFPISDDVDNSIINKKVEIRSAVGYIANELLENAMKFNDEFSQYPISIQLQLHDDHIVFCITNSIPSQKVGKFQAYLYELTHSDPQEMYLNQLEHNAEHEDESSGLGLLTMINDYMAKIGWKFETVTEEPKVIAVTTMVRLFV